MEVHTHTHTARKRWTHYFWEFLMLFLAVFCGFLAENRREHYVELKRAKDYAKSFLTDLRKDTNELRRGIEMTRFIISSIDSVVSASTKKKSAADVPGSFYYHSSFTSALFRIDWSKSTIDQLIQSGNLRYFGDKQLVEFINFYYYMQGIINAQNQMDMVHRDKVLDLRNQVLQSRYYSIFVKLDPRIEQYGHVASPSIDSLMGRQLPLQTGADQHMDEFINHICDRRARLELIAKRYYTLAREVAEDIMERLMEEYNLKLTEGY